MSRMNQHEKNDSALDDQEVLDILGTLQGEDDEEEQEADQGDRGDAVGQEYDGAEDEAESDVEAEDEEQEAIAETDAPNDETTGERESEVNEPADQRSEGEAEETEEPAKSNNENNFIPRARLNKEIQKRKDLQARLDAFEAAQAVQAPRTSAQAQKQAEVDREALGKVINGIIDGDVDNAADALLGVLTTLNNQQSTTSIEPEHIAAMVEQKFENDALARRAGEIIKEHKFLDDTNEDSFDADAAEEVILLRDRYVLDRGMRPVEALEKAVRMVGRDYGYIGDAAPTPTPVAPKLKPADVEKKLTMAKKTPAPVPKGAGEQRGRISLAAASESDFEKASADALRRARGDFL